MAREIDKQEMAETFRPAPSPLMSPEQMKQIVELGGGKYLGFTSENDYVWITDPRSGSSGVVLLHDLTPENVRRKVREIRKRFQARWA
jgi:hypothetical protein